MEAAELPVVHGQALATHQHDQPAIAEPPADAVSSRRRPPPTRVMGWAIIGGVLVTIRRSNVYFHLQASLLQATIYIYQLVGKGRKFVIAEYAEYEVVKLLLLTRQACELFTALVG
jgi:hypothetical protein